ncbi:MAG: SulP family inorganic anion transporter, partial [Litorivicinus sp.]
MTGLNLEGLAFDLPHAHSYDFWNGHYDVGPEFLVALPGSLLDAIAFPDFSVVFSAASFKYVVMFALVGTIESTLSVIAIDSMDPAKRASNLNKDLLGAGVGNLVSASIGGLPMISEIVRSKANIDAGARSSVSNFTHGLLLLVFVAAAPGLLQTIPLAALGAMLVYTGARLAAPSEFIHARQLGMDQLWLFLTTLIVTLATDLLIGVAVGLILKVVLHVARGAKLRD